MYRARYEIMGRAAIVNKKQNKMKTTNAPSVVDDHVQIEKNDSSEKDLIQAISDGNMKAIEANENAEKAPTVKPVQKERKLNGNPQLPPVSLPTKHPIDSLPVKIIKQTPPPVQEKKSEEEKPFITKRSF